MLLGNLKSLSVGFRRSRRGDGSVAHESISPSAREVVALVLGRGRGKSVRLRQKSRAEPKMPKSSSVCAEADVLQNEARPGDVVARVIGVIFRNPQAPSAHAVGLRNVDEREARRNGDEAQAVVLKQSASLSRGVAVGNVSHELSGGQHAAVADAVASIET